MTAAELVPLPETAFASPAPAREYRDQRFLAKSMSALRSARKHILAGNAVMFVLDVSMAAFNLGLSTEQTPSWKRVSRVMSRFEVEAASRLRVVEGRR